MIDLPKGVKFVTLSFPIMKRYWEKLKGFDKLFSDETRGDFEAFCKNLLRPNCYVFEMDGGVVVLENVKPGLRAEVHMSFWDGKKLASKVQTLKDCLTWAFFAYDLEKIEGWVPNVCKSIMRFVVKLGFKLEGRLKNHSKYKGELVDMNIYGLLKEEVL